MTLEKIPIINLNHPCLEVDVYRADVESGEAKAMIDGQGYLTLKSVRYRVELVQDILDNPKAMAILERYAPGVFNRLQECKWYEVL